MCVCFLHVSLCTTCMPGAGRGQNRASVPLNWSYGWLWDTMWVLGIKHKSSERSRALKHCVTPLKLQWHPKRSMVEGNVEHSWFPVLGSLLCMATLSSAAQVTLVPQAFSMWLCRESTRRGLQPTAPSCVGSSPILSQDGVSLDFREGFDFYRLPQFPSGSENSSVLCLVIPSGQYSKHFVSLALLLESPYNPGTRPHSCFLFTDEETSPQVVKQLTLMM